MPLKAVEPRRLYRQIADQLRELIENGEFPVGGRLPSERELADSLGVSRPSVREALIALEVEGLVRIVVGSGIYVLETSARRIPWRKSVEPPEGPFEVLHAREIVESSVAGEAARLAKSFHVRVLDDILDRMGRNGADSRWIELDREFHVAIAASIENGVLARFVGQLFDQRINPYFQQLASYFENANTWRQALDEHRAIRDAIASGDAGAAQAAMRRHLKLSAERFTRGFGEAPSSPPGTGPAPGHSRQAEDPQTLPTKTTRRKQR
ncbi:FadR/GntR family transcriptional regulator [Microvirga pudoricolor]|uniref:FadR/GntR family transcriptional regulator n=1 Tax=Microvirga pudoricolor TaxID=2778729 RepID=UPI00194F49E0|nr:FadR/GntR family transcriptional regulator [Microvirga pudoricolor]MBM6596451.1 FadR family transcriptional regulator [Microvirga pudoricolor]